MTKNENKTAFISGATKGIGYAVAKALATQGYNLFLTARSHDGLRRVASELGSRFPVEVVTKRCDFRLPEELSDLADAVIGRFPALDVLVNNVGNFMPGKVLETDTVLLMEQLQVNLVSMQYLTARFGQQMKLAGRGHIFNIGSVAGRTPFLKAPWYSVTKHAVRGLTNILRLELAPHGLCVTEIVPGSTLTSSWEGVDLPAGRFVQPEDVAAGLVYALSLSPGANLDELVIRPRLGDV